VASLITRYIDAAGDDSDGLTWATAWTSITSFDTGAAKNLVSADEYMEVHLRGATAIPGGSIDNTAWVTDATRYVELIGDFAGTARDTSKAHVELSAVTTQAINLPGSGPEVVKLRNLQIENTAASPTTFGCAVALSSSTSAEVHDCLLIGGRQCVFVNSTGTHYMTNCIAINKSGSGGAGFLSNAGHTGYYYSCVFVGDSYGFRTFSGTSTVTLKNCYASAGITNGDTSTINLTTTATANTSGSSGLQSIAYNTTQFTNVTAGSEDLALPSSGSALYEVGTDTSGDSAPLNFTADIEGTTRTASWDVGVYELSAGGAQLPDNRFIIPTGPVRT